MGLSHYPVISMLGEGGDPSLLLSMLGRSQTTEADPAKVQQLVEMGFLKENAEYLP